MAILGVLFIVVLVVILYVAINSIKKSASAKKQTTNIRSSSGLEKMRLIMRKYNLSYWDSIIAEYSVNKSKEKKYDNLLSVAQYSAITYLLVNDVFYLQLESNLNKINLDQTFFIDLANDVWNNYSRQALISSRILGVSLGIIIYKAAKDSKRSIVKGAVKRLIEKNQIGKDCQKEVIKFANYAINYLELSSHNLENENIIENSIAHGFLDQKLNKSQQKNFSVYKPAVSMAISGAYRESRIDNDTIIELVDSRVIK